MIFFCVICIKYDFFLDNDDKRYEFSNSYLYNMDIDKECKDVVSKMVANIVNRTIMEFFFRVYHYVE